MCCVGAGIDKMVRGGRPNNCAELFVLCAKDAECYPPPAHTRAPSSAVQCWTIPGWTIPTDVASRLPVRSNLLGRTTNPCIDLVWDIFLPVRLIYPRILVCIVVPEVVLLTATLWPRFPDLS